MAIPLAGEYALSADALETEAKPTNSSKEVDEFELRIRDWEARGFQEPPQVLDHCSTRCTIALFPPSNGLLAIAGLGCELGLRETNILAQGPNFGESLPRGISGGHYEDIMSVPRRIRKPTDGNQTKSEHTMGWLGVPR